MDRKTQDKSLNALSPEFTPWTVVNSKSRGKTQRTKGKPEVEFQVHLNHFYDVEPVPFDILVDVPAENCINCLGPRHFKCDKPQSHDYCFNCGRSGVRVNTCPRCRRAYPAYLERRKQSGFGRESKNAKVKPVVKKSAEPVAPKMDAPPPVITDTKAYPLPLTAKETISWSSAAKSSSIIPNAQLTSNNIGWYNDNITETQDGNTNRFDMIDPVEQPSFPHERRFIDRPLSNTMYSTTSRASCGTCKLCRPSHQSQTLMPQDFVWVVSSVNGAPENFFVVRNGLIFGNLVSIPVDPRVDPGPYACFNCWRSGHSHIECQSLEVGYFCQNCGRQNVTMSNCPRCAIAYLEFGVQRMEMRCRGYDDGREVKQLWPGRVKNPLTIYEVPAVPTQNSAVNLPAKSSRSGPFNLYFKALRDVVVQNIQDTKPTNITAEVSEITSSATNYTVSSSGIGDEFLSDQEEDDENLDEIVVDENEKSQPRRPPSQGVREFLNLMKAVKHLPIDAQSSVALQFVRQRRLLMDERKEREER